MEITFDYSELCSLLAEAGGNALVGVEAIHFAPLNEAEKPHLKHLIGMPLA